ncbi:MAG: hypothetical protein HKO57_13070, partial [Akkermansiaceae bacterium]|nr:hypothetical protein [Akkermansiaceae bacterium]
MDTLLHPSELSTWQRFVQARRLHKQSSRSRNPDWFRPALELGSQLHLFVEGSSITAARLGVKEGAGTTWTRIDSPRLDIETEDLRTFLAKLRAEHLSGKARSLGVVLHLADEFAISELAPQQDEPEDLATFRETLRNAPETLLDDQNISGSELSFRFFPYPGTEDESQPGAAITISRKHQAFLRQFREIGEEMKFPIRTAAVSAPLVALGALPKIIPTAPNQPFCALLSYSTFSVLAFFKTGGELLMLRSVRHHSGGVAPNVSGVVQTMAAALELPDPVSLVIPLSQQENGPSVPPLPNASLLNWQQVVGFEPGIPFEFQAATATVIAPEERQGMADTDTFLELDDNQWALQDFLPPSEDEIELYPGPTEMKILRFGSIGVKVAALALLLSIGWTGLRAFQILRDPAWHAKKSDMNDAANQILVQKIKRFEVWDSFLADRSKAWVTMELLNRIFPNPTAVVLIMADHT